MKNVPEKSAPLRRSCHSGECRQQFSNLAGCRVFDADGSVRANGNTSNQDLALANWDFFIRSMMIVIM